jgi:hypothetical protein
MDRACLRWWGKFDSKRKKLTWRPGVGAPLSQPVLSLSAFLLCVVAAIAIAVAATAVAVAVAGGHLAVVVVVRVVALVVVVVVVLPLPLLLLPLLPSIHSDSRWNVREVVGWS